MAYFCNKSTKCLFCKASCELPNCEVDIEKDVDPAPSSDEVGAKAATLSFPDDPSESEKESISFESTENKQEGGRLSRKRDVNCSCHKFPAPFLGSSISKWENIEAYHDNLKYAFLLREMLDYPKRKCVKYMKIKQVESLCNLGSNFGNGKDTNETGWFSVCEACANVVEEGHQIYHDIEKLSLKLDGLKNNLRDLLILSQRENERVVESEEENEQVSIFEEVREYFVSRKSPPLLPPDNDVDIKMEIEGTLPFDGDDPLLDELLANENFDEASSEWVPSDAEEMEDGDQTDNDPTDIKPNIEDLEIEGQDDPNEPDLHVTNMMEKELSKMKPAPKSCKMLRLTRSSTKLDKHNEVNLLDNDDGQGENEDQETMDVTGALKSSNSGEWKRKKSKAILSDSESETSTTDSETSSQSDYDGRSGNKEKFPCELCSAIYYTKHRLKVHEKLHSSDCAYKCPKCPFVSASNRGLKMHTTKIHHKKEKLCVLENKRQIPSSPKDKNIALPIKSYKSKLLTSSEQTCSYCPVRYQTVHRLKEHEEHHSRDDVIKCQQCNFVCLLERGMKIHVSKYHNQKEYNNKIMTGNVGSGEGVHVHHLKEKQEDEEYKCKLCCATYKSPHRIREHKQLHVSKHAIRCAECPYVCRSNKGLIMHTNLKHDINQGISKRKKKVRLRMKKVFTTEPRCCVLCPAKYHTKKRFQQHMTLHSKERNFPCEVCGWVFSEGSKRDFHMRLSHKRTDIKYHRKTYKCSHCDIDEFTFRHKYKEHLRLNHQDKIVQCNTCDDICESQEFYVRHVRMCRKREEISDGDDEEDGDDESVGTEKKIFECTRCNSTFRHNKNLKKHIALKHSTEEFSCEHCPSVFPTESRLRYHLARQHDKIQNVCKICNYKAHGASHLRLHMQKHTKERLFSCEMCDKTKHIHVRQMFR